MRGLGIAVVASFAFAVSLPAVAQSVLDGPLAAPSPVPGAAAPLRSSQPRHIKRIPRHTAAKARAEPSMANETPDRGAPVETRSSTAKSDDPLSLGMKWNGSNDNGSQTRVQNYNGSATGTGAEVGLKLHF